MAKLSNEEYEKMSDEYVKNPPALSGEIGIFSRMRQTELVNELLGVQFARAVNSRAKVTAQPQSKIIETALKGLFERELVAV